MPRLRSLLAAAAALGLVLAAAAPAQAGHRTGTWRNLPNGPQEDHGYRNPGYWHQGYRDGGYGGEPARWGHHHHDRWRVQPYWQAEEQPTWGYRRPWVQAEPTWDDADEWN